MAASTTPARLQQIDELFQSAVALPNDQRRPFLDETCAGDTALREQVEALLAADNEEQEFEEMTKALAADWAAESDGGDRVGQTFGRYQIIAPLAAGGMGEVFLAEDVTLKRKAALKFLPRKFTRAADRLRRFEQEARAASALNHPNIITIYEIGELDGTHFIASELIEGETLNEHLQKRLALDRVLDIGCQAAGALAAAHEAGIVHRDIKPANIMLRKDGYVKLLDFGLAKLTSTAPDLDATEPGRVMGTVSYMSPEQALGKLLDHRTDIFSLGVVLYEIATGRRLFHGESEGATYERILHEEPPPMRDGAPGLPLEFEQVIRRALEKNREQRYASAADLREDLKRLVNRTGETEAAKFAERAQRATRRARRLKAAAVLAALALVLSAAFYFGSRSRVSQATASTATNAIPRKSVAVLPFENVSGDQENAAFTNGVQDQILTDLTKVSELKVINRTSVMRFPAGPARDLRAISRQLGVAFVLEGSVQRAGEKVRLHVQITDAATGERAWAETYERDLADIFAIQSEIAKAIATQLRAQLSPTQKAEIERQPTRDIAAFSLLTRGKALIDEARFGEDSDENFRAGIEFLEEAVARDPSFFVAYSHLAHAHATVFLYGIDNTPGRLAAARAAAEAARRLSPDSGDTHLASAMVLYAAREHGAARAELEVARQVSPNDPRVLELSAYIHRREGRWEESTRELERAREFDPLNVDLLFQVASNYEALHRYEDWAATLDRAIALHPDRIGPRISRGHCDLYARADTGRLRAELETKLREDPASARAAIDGRLLLAFSERDFVAIANALADLGDRRYGSDWARFSRSFGEGLLARMTGDGRAARRAFAADRIAQTALVQTQPEYGPAVSVLGLIEAGLGNKEEALRLGRRAIELLPTSQDSIRGPHMVAHLAIIAAWVGENDLAFEQMRRFEEQAPAGFHYGKLKLDPMWDPLRDDPRFAALLASHAPGGPARK
jgi:serine/threonine protein kinase